MIAGSPRVGILVCNCTVAGGAGPGIGGRVTADSGGAGGGVLSVGVGGRDAASVLVGERLVLRGHERRGLGRGRRGRRGRGRAARRARCGAWGHATDYAYYTTKFLGTLWFAIETRRDLTLTKGGVIEFRK